jgi:hypothetical protein
MKEEKEKILKYPQDMKEEENSYVILTQWET